MPPKRAPSKTNPAPKHKGGPAAQRPAKRARTHNPGDADGDPLLVGEGGPVEDQTPIQALEARNEERFRQIELFQQDLYTRVVEGLDELKQASRPTFAQSLAGAFAQPQSSPATIPQISGTILPPRTDILSQYSWVDMALVQSIASGNFDIYNLPRLHRDSSMRKRHTAHSVEGLLLSTAGAPRLEVVNGLTRLETYFKDINSFYGAWFVYIAIRTHFCPERTSGLLTWMGNLQHLSNLGYSWSFILDYIVKYFQKYQDALPDQWLSTDPEFVSAYITLPSSKPTQYTNSTVPKTTPRFVDTIQLSKEICLNHNTREKGCTYEVQTGRRCGRLHVCSNCNDKDHTKMQCKKPRKTD